MTLVMYWAATVITLRQYTQVRTARASPPHTQATYAYDPPGAEVSVFPPPGAEPACSLRSSTATLTWMPPPSGAEPAMPEPNSNE